MAKAPAILGEFSWAPDHCWHAAGWLGCEADAVDMWALLFGKGPVVIAAAAADRPAG